MENEEVKVATHATQPTPPVAPPVIHPPVADAPPVVHLEPAPPPKKSARKAIEEKLDAAHEALGVARGIVDEKLAYIDSLISQLNNTPEEPSKSGAK